MTLIKKKWRRQNETKNVTSLQELLDVKEQMEELLRQGQKVEYGLKRYRIAAYAFDVGPESLAEAKKSGRGKKNYFQIQFMLKDQSIDDTNDFLEAYLYPTDQNPKNAVPGIDLTNPKVTPEQEQRFSRFRENLLVNSSLENLCELIVEPLEHKNEIIFRIIDTKFKDEQ